jgi:hypothetical protein
MQPPAWESLPEHASAAEGPAGAAGNGGHDGGRKAGWRQAPNSGLHHVSRCRSPRFASNP